jgi:osmotically-inducible protein OsmY
MLEMEEHRNRALLESVREHLMGDVRLAGQSIYVTANAGYIQVVGVVDTEEHKHVALELARGMAGVRNVEDRIEVRNTAAR